MENMTTKKMLTENAIQPEEVEPSQESMTTDGTSSNYDTLYCQNREDERECTTINVQHSPHSDDNENLQEEDYLYDNDQSIGGCLRGREVSDLNDALNLYRAHARALGFSVRKGTTRRRGISNVIFEKYYVCSKSGLRGKGKKQLQTDSIAGISPIEASPPSTNERKRKVRVVIETRTDCKAYIRFKLTKEGRFTVTDHNINHNHEFVKPEGCHCLHPKSRVSFLKGVRKVTETTAAQGTQPMDSYSYLSNGYTSEELKDNTKIDQQNFVSRCKSKNIEGVDMQNVLDAMQQRTRDDDSFFYGIKVNESNQVVGIFWRDSMMLEDYLTYGDVLIFDTTYRTNRYNLICVPFFGVNNHWKTTMFACAFICEEKTETYEWLLEIFKKSMQGVVPKSIFTDQNLTMDYAIAKVYPTSRHRLCIWRLEKKFISELDMQKSDPTLECIFNNCLSGCNNEDEFSKRWTEMVNTYDLREKNWFSRLYDMRNKWCTALSKDFFSAGISPSQKLEKINSAISFKDNNMASLFELYHAFEDIVKRWRSLEESDNFKCTTEDHPASKSHCKLLKHAAEVYTLDVFDDFQKEFDMAMGSYIRVVENQGDSKKYEVSLNEDFKQNHNVVYDEELLELSCSCMSYQECGLLCYHILRVMHMHCIFEIPPKYITKRWTKLAKSRIWSRSKDDNSDASTLEEKKKLHTPWRHTMACNFYNLLTTCQFDESARVVCEKGLDEMCSAVKQNLAK